MTKRTRTSIALVLVLALAAGLAGVAGCTPAKPTVTKPAGDQPVKGGTLKYYIGEPSYIDPWNGQESEGVEVISAVYDSLVDFDPTTSEIRAAAATSWKANADQSVWTFTLRKGAKFHNGRAVTAKDFKYAWERIADPKNESEIAYHLNAIKGVSEMQDGPATEISGVKAVNDTTLEVTLTEPFAEFIFVVGHPSLAPVPKEEVDKDPAAFKDKPIGNGPFMLTEPWAHDQGIKTVAFKDYNGEMPNIDEIDFKIFKDDETAFLEFEAGNLDFVRIPSGQIAAVKTKYGESTNGWTAAPDKQALLGPETAIYYMTINNEDPILKNADVRRAISLAINRQALADTVYEGVRKPADGQVPPGIKGYEEGAFKYAKYDVAEAKKLLEKAGYPGGAGLPEFSFTLNTGRGHEDVAQVIIADLAAIGIKCKIDGVEAAAFWDLLQAGKYQLARDGWIGDYPIWDNFLYPAFYSKNINADDHSRYSNAKVDAMFAEARKTGDEEKRIAKYLEIEKTVGDDAATVPLVFYAHQHVASKRVRNLTYSPMGLTNFTELWITK